MSYQIRRTSDTFTRPADTTAYADNDLVANSTTAGDVDPLVFNVGRGGFKIVAARLSKSDASDVANATFTLHFFENSPTVANGDNGAISFDVAGYLGSISFATMVAGTDDAYAIAQQGMSILPDGINGYTAGSNIYGLIQAEAAYGPASAETFTAHIVYEKH